MKKRCLCIILVLACFITCSQTYTYAQEKTEYILSGKNESNASYMGIVNVNFSLLPYTFFNFIGTSAGIQTSHGVYFTKQKLYTGISVEYIAFPPSTFIINPHIRYYYGPAGNKTVGYIGAEAGIMVGPYYQDAMTDPEELKAVYFDCAIEIGMLINFKNISLDLGLKPHLLGSNIILPLKIGIVF